MAKTRKIRRSAVTGRFVTKATVKRKPRETVTETRRTRKRKKK